MKYEHIVYIDQNDERRMLRVDRLFENGKRMFMCEFEIKSSIPEESALWDEFEKLGSLLGKSICIDCPDLRAIMGVD